MIRNTTLSVTLACFSCCTSDNKEVQVVKSNNEKIYIYINHDNGISVDTKTDSVHTFERVVTDTNPNSPYHYTFETRSSTKSESLADSLSWLANQIIRDSVTCNDEVTCYAGDYLQITITKGLAKYSASFNSVNDWKDCSANAKELARLLKQNNLLKDEE